MISKKLTAAAALCLAGLMLTACGNNNKGTTGTSNTTTSNQTSQMNPASESSSSESGGLDANDGRDADIDGDGFVEDVVTGAEDIVGDAVNGAENIVEDIIPGETDHSTMTTR